MQLPLFSEQLQKQIDDAQHDLAYCRYFESLVTHEPISCPDCDWELSTSLCAPLSKGVVTLILRGRCGVCLLRDRKARLDEDEREGSET